MSSAAGAVRAGRAFVELFAEDSRLVRGLRAAQAKLKAFGTSVRAMGQKMLFTGTLAAAPLAAATVTFAKFEYQMSRVKALTGETGEGFKRLEDKARQLGRDTVFSASQAAEAMSIFALAGYDADRIMTAIGPTLDLAAAGQIEIAEAADIATKVMAGMGIAAEDFGGTVDVMTKAMTTANTDMFMLGEAFKFVGPMAKTAGVSLEEITAAIQLLSNAGIQGEMAGTTLRGVILSLTSPSKEARDMLDKLGIKVNDAKGDFRGLVPIITDLEAALSGMGSGKRLEVLGTVFPARQAAGAAELVAQGADALRAATEALGDSGGTAARIAATQLDNLQGDAVLLTSALEGVAIAAGKAWEWITRSVTQGVTRVLVDFEQWISANEGAASAVFLTVAAVIGLGAALFGVGVVFQAVAFGIGGLATMVAWIGAGLAFLMSPLGMVATGLGALGYLFATSTDAGRDWMAGLSASFNSVAGDAMAAFEVIKGALSAGDWGTAAAVAWGLIQLEWARGIAWITEKWIDGKGVILDVWSGACTAIAQGWISTVHTLSDAWTGFLAEFQTGYTKAYTSIAKFLALKFMKEPEKLIEDIDRQAAVKLDKIKTERDSKINESEEKRKKTQADIDQAAAAESDARHKAAADGIAAADAEYQAKRDAFQKSLDDAKAALQEADAEEAAKKAERDAAVGGAINGASTGGSIATTLGANQGTFSQNFDRMFASIRGDDYAKDTARNTAETARGIKKLTTAKVVYGK